MLRTATALTQKSQPIAASGHHAGYGPTQKRCASPQALTARTPLWKHRRQHGNNLSKLELSIQEVWKRLSRSLLEELTSMAYNYDAGLCRWKSVDAHVAISPCLCTPFVYVAFYVSIAVPKAFPIYSARSAMPASLPGTSDLLNRLVEAGANPELAASIARDVDRELQDNVLDAAQVTSASCGASRL